MSKRERQRETVFIASTPEFGCCQNQRRKCSPAHPRQLLWS